MPSRINHVKMITPEPALVDAFLREVCDVPGGWPIGEAVEPLAPGAPLGPGGDFTPEQFAAVRQVSGGGFIVGDPASRQVQVFAGPSPAIWALCISTRFIEDVYERALARGVPCTPVTVADWNERDDIRNFFCIVGGIVFEVIRVEPKAAP